MTTRTFPTDVILSVVTGSPWLCADQDDTYRLLSYMTGLGVRDGELLQSGRACAAALLEQHPRLRVESPPEGLHRDNAKQWLADVERIVGTDLTVAPLAALPHDVL